jgi:hypothetical protein
MATSAMPTAPETPVAPVAPEAPVTPIDSVAPAAPETPAAPATPSTTGRYQVNPDVVIDRETANKELGNNYTELAEDDFVNSEE